MGAVIGDVVGSAYEFHNIYTKDFPFLSHRSDFTDDSVMTIAVAEALLRWKETGADLKKIARKTLQEIGRKYPYCGYGGRFFGWMFSENPKPYHSFGNGSAMRVSAAAYVGKTMEEVKMLSHQVTAISHNHPEGLKGAEATAIAVFMALHGAAKDEIREVMEKEYYPCGVTLAEYRRRKDGHGAETCMVSMPQALQCFYEGEDYEDVIRSCVSIGGDCDTTGAIAGAIAGAYYGIEDELYEKVKMQYLPADLREIVENFDAKYGG